MTLQRHRLKAAAFAFVSRFFTRLQAWPLRLTPAPFRLMQIGSAFWQSRVLYLAASLDLATVLGERAMHFDELAQAVATDAQSLYRLLRMLVAMDIFQEHAPGVFRNNAVSQALRSDRADNVRAMVLLHNCPAMCRPWFEFLEQGVRSGQPPFALTHGVDLFDYMDAHPAFDALFAQAMDSVQALTGDSFASEFNWQAFDRVIDVGGSRGSKSLAILKRHAHLRALVVDRAATIRQAQAYWLKQQQSGPLQSCLARLEFQVGDIFETLPQAQSRREVFLLSAVLHGFDDAQAQRALCNLAQAARPAGATIVLLEMILPDLGADLMAASFDLQMLMGTRGHERTRGQWQALFDHSGLQWVETVDLASFGKMLVLSTLADNPAELAQ